MRARASALVFLWRHHRAALIALGLALAVAAFFAVRLAVFTIYWADPAHREQRIEGWMTPGYVARSWDVDPDVVRTALPAPPAVLPGSRPTLAQIARAEDVPLRELVVQIETAIAGAQTE